MPAAKLGDQVLTFRFPHLSDAGRERVLMLDGLESGSQWDEGWSLAGGTEPFIVVTAEVAKDDPQTVVLSVRGLPTMQEHTAKSLLLDFLIFSLNEDIASFRQKSLQWREDRETAFRNLKT